MSLSPGAGRWCVALLCIHNSNTHITMQTLFLLYAQKSPPEDGAGKEATTTETGATMTESNLLANGGGFTVR